MNEYNINYIVILHIIIILLYIILPFLPIKIIIDYSLYWFIIIPPLLWVIFCRCPLTDFENIENKKHISNLILDTCSISQKRYEYIIIFYLILSGCIIIDKIINYYNKL